MPIEVSIYDPETDTYLAGELDPATGDIIKPGGARVASPHHLKTKGEVTAREARIRAALRARAVAFEAGLL